MKDTYELREMGRAFCQTEGSEHYKGGDIEAMDLIRADGNGEGFCLGSITKYASRYKRTQNLNDLKKVSDYAQILCGIKLAETEEKE